MIRAMRRRVITPALTLLETRCYFGNTRCRQEKSNKSSSSQEDGEELERERELRERFSQKIETAMPQYGRQGAGNCSSGNCADQPTSSFTSFFRFMFFLISLFFLMTLLQMTDTNSSFNVMQTIRWWQLPISSTSYFILMRVLLPYREQTRIKEEYELAQRFNPSLTLDQFFTQRYPTMFQGYRTQQQEVVAAVSACLASASDLRFVRAITRAVGSARDTKGSVDIIIDTLKRDYPHLFQNHGGSPPVSSMGA